MGTVGTAADAVQIYLTGAPWHEAHQSDPVLSRGGYRASDRAQILEYHRTNPIRGIRIVWASGGNVQGVGSLVAVDADTMRWTAPGDTVGASVAIAYGETKTVVSGTASAFLVIERTGTADLYGIETVQIIGMLNNVVGMTNFDVTDHGYYQYRNIALVCRLAVTSIEIELATANEVLLQFSYEAEVDGAVQVVDEFTAPSGLSSPWTTDLYLGSQLAGTVVRPWVRTAVGVSADPSAAKCVAYKITYVVAGVTYTQTLPGYVRIQNDAWERHELWHGIDAPPNPAVDTPTTFTPPLADYALTAGHTHYLQLAARDAYGALGPYGKMEVIPVGADGGLEGVRPHGPSLVQVTAGPGGTLNVTAAYYPTLEDPLSNRASEWRVYVTTDGTTPDPDVDTPEIIAMVGDDADRSGREILVWDSDPALDGTTFNVLVRTAREEEVEDAPSVYWESTNEDVYTATAAYWGPVRPAVHVAHERGYGQALAAIAGPDGDVVYIDEVKNIRWIMGVGYTALYAGDDLVLTFRQNYGATALCGLFTAYSIEPWTATGAGSAAGMEVGTWTESVKELFVCVGPSFLRMMKIDVTNGVVYVYDHVDPNLVTESRASVPCWPLVGDTVFQVWDPETDAYETAACLDLAGVFRVPGGISPS